MKINKTTRSTEIANNVVSTKDQAYLYELSTNGNLNQRHSMVLTTITTGLAKKGIDINNANALDGYSFHNLCVSAQGPYILNNEGEQVYTFSNNGTMVKLSKGTKHPETNHHVKFNKGIYSCVSADQQGVVKSIDYLAILANGSIRFTYKYAPTSLRMTILTDKEMPENVMKHLLATKVEQKLIGSDNDQELKSTNNPGIGFKLLLDLLSEEETNGINTDNKN